MNLKNMLPFKHSACRKIRLAVIISFKKALFNVKTLSKKLPSDILEVLAIKITLHKFLKPRAAICSNLQEPKIFQA